MASNYKRLGDYIEEVDERNSEGFDIPIGLQGKTKTFIETVANVSETDLSNYKLLKNNYFAFSPMQVGRDERLSISLYKSEKTSIISPAYITFRVKSENKLLPEYLMMYFRRKESDRFFAYISDCSIRSSISWEDMCNVLMPIPNIKRQRAFIEKYNAIMGLINSAKEQENILKNTMEDISEKFFENLKR